MLTYVRGCILLKNGKIGLNKKKIYAIVIEKEVHRDKPRRKAGERS